MKRKKPRPHRSREWFDLQSFRIPTSTRGRMENEMDAYLAAINVDTQFAVRKVVFIIRSLRLPERMSVEAAIEELERLLAGIRERTRFGRPWTYRQLRNCYWYSTKRFKRRPTMPMTPEEWASYQPYLLPEEARLAHLSWVRMRRKGKAAVKD